MQGHAERTPSMHRETARANTNRRVTTRACKLLVTIYLLSSPPPVSPLFHHRKSSHRIVLVSFHTPSTQMQSSPNTRIPPLKISISSSASRASRSIYPPSAPAFFRCPSHSYSLHALSVFLALIFDIMFSPKLLRQTPDTFCCDVFCVLSSRSSIDKYMYFSTIIITWLKVNHVTS